VLLSLLLRDNAACTALAACKKLRFINKPPAINILISGKKHFNGAHLEVTICSLLFLITPETICTVNAHWAS
jgi:hypothetical protein